MAEITRLCGSSKKTAARIEQPDTTMCSLVAALGGGKSVGYRRERKQALTRILSEVYSPPRVTAAIKMLPSLRLIPGFALDLITTDEDGRPCDFSLRRSREKARRLLERQKPALIVGSPMCTDYSSWQRINDCRGTPADGCGQSAPQVRVRTL